MLNSEGRINLELIKQVALCVWGKKCCFINEDIKDTPFCLFDVYLCIYDRFDIRLCYDRSILDIAIKLDGKYVWLDKLTQRELIQGFDSTKPESMQYNFGILDEVLCAMEKTYKA